jgi:hypothetical protein
MSIGSVTNNISFYLGLNKPANTYQATASSVPNVYKSDSITLSVSSEPIPKPVAPNQPPQDPPYQPPSFFNKPEVRLAGMCLGSAAVLGGLGYAVGAALGSAGAGLAVGIGLGVITPIAMIAYAISKFT